MNTIEYSGNETDILVSVSIVADSPIEVLEQSIEKILPILEMRYEFFEILIVAAASYYTKHENNFTALLEKRNLRCLIFRDGVGEYRATVIGIAESIGDLVMILSAEECPTLDLNDMLDTAEKSGGSVVLRRARRAGIFAQMSGLILSTISGYNVDPRVMRSCVHHRAWINRVVNRADGEVAVRFMPRTGRQGVDATILTVDAPRPKRSGFRIGRRLVLASEVLMYAPPHLLRMLAGISILVMIGSILFFLYAIFLYAIGFELEPGWLTISLAISGSTAFVSLAFGAISTALFQILNNFGDKGHDEIQNELDNTDLFREFRRVNVDTLDGK